MKSAYDILVIGKPEAGKSSLQGQLQTHLDAAKTALSLSKERTKNLSGMSSIQSNQALGLKVDRTSKEKDIETIFKVELENGEIIELIWPDYAGEKIEDIVEGRQVTEAWSTRIKKSAVWMLFIRMDHLEPLDNLLTRPQEDIAKISKEKQLEFSKSDYAFFIELLQIFCAIRGIGITEKVNKPALQVVLTFWDDIEEEGKEQIPIEILKMHCPLLVDFIESVWFKDRLSFVGLSPQEMPLEKDMDESMKSEQCQDFADAPEDFGYVIADNGDKKQDLTFLIQNALNLIQ